MTPAVWGAVLGATLAGGLLLVGSRVVALRRPRLELRVLPYIRDLPQVAAARPTVPTSAASGVFGPLLRAAAEGIERVLGGAASVRRRLERAGLAATVPEFRVQQVVWGLVAFGVAAAYSLVKALTHPGGAVSAVLLCLTAFAVAVERGTPLADVLHAQAADVRDAGRRELIEIAARREVAMMVPVVFLVLPVTVLFAFWPGVVGLSLTTP